MNIQIRKAQKEDLLSLSELLTQLTVVGSISNQPDPSIYDNIYVAIDKGRCVQGVQGVKGVQGSPGIPNIIGCITILIEPKIIHNGSYVGHIEDVVVNKTHRGLGIGKMLINYGLKVAKENGCYKVILDCDESNVEFYKKSGFKQKGVCMRYDISSKTF